MGGGSRGSTKSILPKAKCYFVKSLKFKQILWNEVVGWGGMV